MRCTVQPLLGKVIFARHNGDLVTAAQLGEDMLAHARKIAYDPDSMCDHLGYVADIYLELLDYRRADQLLSEAVVLFESGNVGYISQGDTLLMQGRVKNLLGDFSTSKKLAGAALKNYQTSEHNHGIQRAIEFLAELENERDGLEK